MPQGYGVPKTERGLMPWATTRKILEGARSYWLVTIDADGKPHLVGQWGAWIEERWYLGAARTRSAPETSRRSHGSRWAPNLGRPQSWWKAVLRGFHRWSARPPSGSRSSTGEYGRIYKYRPRPEQWDKGGYVLTPAKVLAWDVRGFPRSVTRYLF
jgi:hypothetical protein